MKRVDERDIMFSRMNYQKGTYSYEDYYKRNPDKKEIDGELRKLPELGEEGSAYFNPINSPIVNATFKFLADIKKYSEGNASKKEIEVDPNIITKRIKGIANYYNAKLVGITEMKDYHYYSHRGRMEENYGEEIKNHHKYGIVFAVEMDKDMIYRAPQLSESIAVTKGYVEAAVIGMVLSYYIRELGYDARNHMDGNYLVIAPILAQDAGLGQIGRNGLLLTKEFGPRVRLGVVTTDMPLITDPKNEFGIKEFCDECGKCAKTCPGRAIPEGEQQEIDGINKWKINAEECYRRWRSLGTDCGVCLASCPLSDSLPNELLENMKLSSETRKEIFKRHEEKNGIRPFIRGNADWL